MQAVKQLFIIFLAFFSLFGLSAPAAHSATAWTATVESVGDGDSFKARRNGRTVRGRLYGIDSPEFKQRYGYQSRQLARQLLPKRGEIVVYPVDRDQYGRVVGLVRSGGILVNREMVRQGAAWLYPRYCRERAFCAELKVMQEQARSARLGLWQDANPEPPWIWKRRQSHKR